MFFDFPFTEASVWCSLYCLLMYALILTNNYRWITKPQQLHIAGRTSNHLFLTLLMGFVIVTLCTPGDFFHMMEYVHGYNFIAGAYNYGEEVYVEIAKIVNRNYFLFRTIVWGGAYLLFCLTARRMGVPIYQAATFLFLTHSLIFGYARATAAMAVYYFGLSFLCLFKRNVFSVAAGVGCILLAPFLHTSAYILVAVTLILLIPLRKWTILATVIAIPLAVGLLKTYFLDFALGAGNERLTAKVSGYLQRENRESGIAVILINAFQYASFYVPVLILILKTINKRIRRDIPSMYLRLIKTTVALAFISLVFITFGEGFKVYIYRILFMTMIPLAILIPALFNRGILSKHEYKWCLWLGIIFMLLRYAYHAYVSYLG